jgi:tRNA threonylcarbamoyladenosine biosynthesis protein TsaE
MSEPLSAGQPATARLAGPAGPGSEARPTVTARLSVPGAAQMRQLGTRLAGVLGPADLVVLAGSLGAGKTTLVQGIGEGLGVRGPVTSPTFVIARVHPSLRGGPDLVHADAYRLGSRLEVDDLDLDADLDHSVTVVEWGEGLVEALAAAHLRIAIDRAVPDAVPSAEPGNGSAEPEDGTEDQPRSVTVTGYGSRWAMAAAVLRAALSGSQR